MTTTYVRRRIPPKRMLVVEDEPLVGITIQKFLIVDGHTIEMAANGPQALSMFGASQYDLVITDFQLGGMDGLEVAAAIKKLSPTKPIILITAYADKLSREMGKVSNVDLVLNKPFSVAQLHEALGKIFPEPQATG